MAIAATPPVNYPRGEPPGPMPKLGAGVVPVLQRPGEATVECRLKCVCVKRSVKVWFWHRCLPHSSHLMVPLRLLR